MRWDNLFDDLEGQLEQELTLEEVDLRAEEERLRLGRMSLRDRIRSLHATEGPHVAYAVDVLLVDGSRMPLRPITIGRDWFSADLVDAAPTRTQCVVPLTAIAGFSLTRAQIGQSLSEPSTPDSGPGLSARLTLSFVLRDLCRRRAGVEVRLVDGTVSGTIDRVGRDHLDVAVHERGSARRESVVTEYRVIPFDRVVMVRL